MKEKGHAFDRGGTKRRRRKLNEILSKLYFAPMMGEHCQERLSKEDE